MKRYFFFILFLILWLSVSEAQQVHFSQFYNAPLLLNPALTGNNECIMRAGGGYRDQWRAVSRPYQTYDFFADIRIQSYKLKHNWFGLGLQFYGDKAGTSRLGTSDVRLCFAYHQGMIKKNQLIFSLGISASYVSHSIDFSNLYFGNQWMGSGFDPTASSFEPSHATTTSYIDVNAGLLMTYFVKYELNFHIGASMDHLTKPHFSFIGGDNQLGWRTLVHAGLNAIVSRKVALMPKAYFSLQDHTQEIVFGTNLAYTPRVDPIFFGLWYRWNRDIVPLVGYGLKGFNLMFSYDINISRFRLASRVQGGFEISLVKSFLCDPKFFKKKDSKYRKKGLNNCPIF
jgi:type IX secretion system PorP/SprF family membrane protein